MKVIPLVIGCATSLFLLLVLLMNLTSRETGRSALYSLASAVRIGFEVAGAAFPALVRVIEGLPDAFRLAWARERPSRDFEVYRKSA